MSLSLPEFAVRDVIEHVINVLGDDPRIVEDMLASRPASERDSFRTALLQREGKVRLGWSMDVPEDWSVTVLLAGTQARHTLGDIASMLTEDVRATRTLSAGISAAEGIPLTASLPVSTGATPEVPPRGLLYVGDEIAIYSIASSTCTLTYRGVRGTAAAAHAGGSEVNFFTVSQRLGWPETVTLRVDVIGSNAAWMMMLARMVQAFLLHARDLFEDGGYTLQDVTAGDLQPRSSAWPAHLYVRTLTLTMFTALSLPEFIPAITETTFTPIVENMEVPIASFIA